MSSPKLLSDLTSREGIITIRVRVISKGNIKARSRFHKTELLLGDETGNMIQASFFHVLDSSTIISLEEGHCYEIKKFILTTASLSCVRLTKNRHHIKLNNSTVITKIDPFPNVNYYCFPTFDDLYRGLVHPKFSTDIYGAIVGVGFLEEFMPVPGFIDHKIRFFVLHTDNVVMKCVAYGTLAHVFQDLWNSTNADVVLCVLQFWQINWGKGKLKNVSTIDGFSKIIFEPKDVPEIDIMRQRIADGEF